jgi:hypothetical protein
MYDAKETVRKTLAARVAQASASPVLTVKGETVKVTTQELLATLDAMFGRKG